MGTLHASVRLVTLVASSRASAHSFSTGTVLPSERRLDTTYALVLRPTAASWRRIHVEATSAGTLCALVPCM